MVKTNVQRCEDYKKKLGLVGKEIFKFETDEVEDKVTIIKYIPNDEPYRVIEIPPFVTHVASRSAIFRKVTQSLKVINKSKIEDASYLFYEFSGDSLDLSEFDVSNITNMKGMFGRCINLVDLNLNNFNTFKVIDMERMFVGCANIKVLDLSGFDTSNVKDMGGMFSGCSALTKISLESFNTEKVESMSQMFYSCKSLHKINIDNFRADSLKKAKEMFGLCVNTLLIEMNNFNPSEDADLSDMFYYCTCMNVEMCNNINRDLLMEYNRSKERYKTLRGFNSNDKLKGR